jgi:iron complex transport system substrate-binding protein
MNKGFLFRYSSFAIRHSIFCGSLLLLLIMLPASSPARELSDLTGRLVRVPEQPRRVVSLAPSITEIIFALGQEEVLQGTTQFSDHPPAARKIPRVGSYVHPDLERIVALKPDLVLATRDGNPLHLIERLEALGIPVFAVDPRNIGEIMNTISALGKVLNARPHAEALVAEMAVRMEQVRQKVALTGHRPLVFFQIDAAPMVSVGEATFLHELIILAGGRNAAAGGPAYPRFGWEEILRLQPEITIITSMGGGQSPQELLGSWQRWPQLQAVQKQRVHVVDADLFDRPTHRLVDGLEILARLIHPGLYQQADVKSER